MTPRGGGTPFLEPQGLPGVSSVGLRNCDPGRQVGTGQHRRASWELGVQRKSKEDALDGGPGSIKLGTCSPAGRGKYTFLKSKTKQNKIDLQPCPLEEARMLNSGATSAPFPRALRRARAGKAWPRPRRERRARASSPSHRAGPSRLCGSGGNFILPASRERAAQPWPGTHESKVGRTSRKRPGHWVLSLPSRRPSGPRFPGAAPPQPELWEPSGRRGRRGVHRAGPCAQRASLLRERQGVALCSAERAPAVSRG